MPPPLMGGMMRPPMGFMPPHQYPPQPPSGIHYPSQDPSRMGSDSGGAGSGGGKVDADEEPAEEEEAAYE